MSAIKKGRTGAGEIEDRRKPGTGNLGGILGAETAGTLAGGDTGRNAPGAAETGLRTKEADSEATGAGRENRSLAALGGTGFWEEYEFPEALFEEAPASSKEEQCLRLIARLAGGEKLTEEEFFAVLSVRSRKTASLLFRTARRVREQFYGKRVFIRGLIEFTNYCRNDCYYCGIRRSNREADRYRLTQEEILACCEEGFRLGFRTFVLQGGEDGGYGREKGTGRAGNGREKPGLEEHTAFYKSDLALAETVRAIKSRFPGCAVTLSAGERPREIYELWFDAGADRYLLRHETADEEHYRMLHPSRMSGSYRKECLKNLKEIGFQTGAGMMIGSPGQTERHLARDLIFLRELKPEMVGIGPFIPHHATPFAGERPGSRKLTLYVLGLVRLLLPKVLLPATTALGTIVPGGRELGLLCGANVVMPNLSPASVREKYLLYDNKLSTGKEAAEGLMKLRRSVENIGYEIVAERGDWAGFQKKERTAGLRQGMPAKK